MFDNVLAQPAVSRTINEIFTDLICFNEDISTNTSFFENEINNRELENFENRPDYASFLFLKKPSFISFFLNNFVDVPICFKKSKSLRRKNFELPLLKMPTLLMKKGKKEKITKLFFNALRKQNHPVCDNGDESSWYLDDFFWITTQLSMLNRLYVHNDGVLLFLRIDNVKKEVSDREDAATYSESSESDEFDEKNDDLQKQELQILTIKKEILNKLLFVNPVFAYFIFSVDKNIRKFSRGKSGKYRFVWKYVAPYKRTHIVLKWLAKEIKFINEKTMTNRIQKMFLILKNSPETSFTWKSKQFSHMYVFKNFKKTLMTNLKTTI